MKVNGKTTQDVGKESYFYLQVRDMKESFMMTKETEEELITGYQEKNMMESGSKINVMAKESGT